MMEEWKVLDRGGSGPQDRGGVPNVMEEGEVPVMEAAAVAKGVTEDREVPLTKGWRRGPRREG